MKEKVMWEIQRVDIPFPAIIISFLWSLDPNVVAGKELTSDGRERWEATVGSEGN